MRGSKIFTVISFVILTGICLSQSGGTYEIKQSVIAGGGAGSSGGAFGLEGTIGQAAASSIISGGVYALQGGFWTREMLVPTAAPASVSGRITSPDGVQMNRVSVDLVNVETGSTRSVRPNTFGYFRFTDVTLGLYVLRARSRTYTFAPSESVIDLSQDAAGIEFVATPINPR